MDKTTILGPNVKRLLIERCAQLSVERSGDAGGPFGKAVAVAARLAGSQGNSLQSDLTDAFEWVQSAIAAVRSAPDCPWSSDEEIAGEILNRVALRRAPGKRIADRGDGGASNE